VTLWGGSSIEQYLLFENGPVPEENVRTKTSKSRRTMDEYAAPPTACPQLTSLPDPALILF
jgi:hypothetical protein